MPEANFCRRKNQIQSSNLTPGNLRSSAFICGLEFVFPSKKLCTVRTTPHNAPQIGFDPQNHSRQTSKQIQENPQICHLASFRRMPPRQNLRSATSWRSFFPSQELCTICTCTHIAPQIGFDPQNHSRRTAKTPPRTLSSVTWLRFFVSQNAPSPKSVLLMRKISAPRDDFQIHSYPAVRMRFALQEKREVLCVLRGSLRLRVEIKAPHRRTHLTHPRFPQSRALDGTRRRRDPRSTQENNRLGFRRALVAANGRARFIRVHLRPGVRFSAKIVHDLHKDAHRPSNWLRSAKPPSTDLEKKSKKSSNLSLFLRFAECPSPFACIRVHSRPNVFVPLYNVGIPRQQWT